MPYFKTFLSHSNSISANYEKAKRKLKKSEMTSNLSSDFSDDEPRRTKHKDDVPLPIMEDNSLYATALMQNLERSSFNRPLTSNPCNNSISQTQPEVEMDSVPQSSNEGMKLNLLIKLYGYYKI